MGASVGTWTVTGAFEGIEEVGISVLTIALVVISVGEKVSSRNDGLFEGGSSGRSDGITSNLYFPSQRQNVFSSAKVVLQFMNANQVGLRSRIGAFFTMVMSKLQSPDIH